MNIKGIIFDLDGTLYFSKELSKAHLLHIINLLSRKMQISKQKAQKLLKLKRKKLASKLGYNPPLTMLIETFGVKKLEFYNEIELVDPYKYIKPDAKLRQVMNTLKKKGLKLALLTNVSRMYTLKILDALAINWNIFDCIVTGSDVTYIKPNSEPFYRILKALNLNSHQVLMVGDRFEIDLLPAKRLGMKTALVLHSRNSHVKKGLVDIILHEIYDLIDNKRLETIFL